MSAADKLPPPPRLVAISAAVLAVILFWVILTIWMPDRWTFGFAEAVVLGLATAWAAWYTISPFRLKGSPVMIALAGAVAIGLMQLTTSHTVNRWETWNAVLRWAVYLAAFVLAAQIGASAAILAPFRRALLYFGFALSVVCAVQFYTAPDTIFWLFPSEYSYGFGPFANPDRYAAFAELILPLALFEALADRRKMLLGVVMSGFLVASVIEGASRAGSFLVIAESVAVLALAAWRGVGSVRRVSLVFTALLLGSILVFTSVVGWSRIWDKTRADPYPFRLRREMLLSAAAMTRDRPWTGFGLGSFETAYPGYARFDFGVVVDHAHNDWAEWAAEGGLPFLACMVAAAALSLPRLARPLWGLGVLSVWLHSLVDFPMQTRAIALWLFVLWGAAWAESKPFRRRPVSG